MEVFKLDSLKGGWFAGDFDPTLFPSRDFEVAVKRYRKGDYEKSHYHKIAVEFTVIVSGEVTMNGQLRTAGDIIRIAPGEATDFLVLSEEAVTTVLKVPSVPNDKYLTEE